MGPCSRVGYGRGTLSRLVGKESPVDPAVKGKGYGGAQKATAGCRAGKYVLDYCYHGGPDVIVIEGNDQDGAGKVDEGHSWYQGLGDFGDAFDAANNYKGQKNGQDNIGVEVGDRKCFPEGVGYAVDLWKIAGTKGGENGGHGKKCRQHFSKAQGASRGQLQPKAFFHIVHRTACYGAIRCFFAVFVRKGNFNKLGSHTNYRRYQHPKQRCRSPQVQSKGHTGYVPGAHGSR